MPSSNKPPFPMSPVQEAAGPTPTMKEVDNQRTKLEDSLRQKNNDLNARIQNHDSYKDFITYSPVDEAYAGYAKKIADEAEDSTKKVQEFLAKQTQAKKLPDDIKALTTKKEANENNRRKIQDQLNNLSTSLTIQKIKLAQSEIRKITEESTSLYEQLEAEENAENKNALIKKLEKLEATKKEHEKTLATGNKETYLKQLKDLDKELKGIADDEESKEISISGQLTAMQREFNAIQDEIGKTEEARKEKLKPLQEKKDEWAKIDTEVSPLIKQLNKNKEILDRLHKEAEKIKKLNADELETELPKIHNKTTKLLKDDKGVIPDYKDLHDEIEALHKKRTQFLEGPTQSSVVAEHFDSLSLKAHGTHFTIKGNTPEKTKELQKNLDRKIDEANRTGSVIIDGVEVIRTAHGFQAKESGLKGAMLALNMTIGRSNPDEAELIVSGGGSITCNNTAALLALGHGVKSLKFGTPPSLNADSTLIERIFEINSDLPSAKSYEMVGGSKFAALFKAFNEPDQPTDPAALTRLTLSALNPDNIKKVMGTEGLPHDIIKEQLPFAMIAKLQRSSNSQATLSEIHTIFNNLDSNGKKVFLEKLHGKFNSMSVFTRRGSVYYNFFKKVIEDFKTKKDDYKDFYESVPKEKGADSLKNWIKECGGEPPHPRNEEHELMDVRNNGVRH